MFNIIKKILGIKKEIQPDELGQLLYQVIQMGLSDDRLSVESLLDQLSLTENDVVKQYQAEIIIALMYQAIVAVVRRYEYPLAGDVLDGMTKEFFSHYKEMDGTDEDSLLALFQQRVKEYYEAESNTAGHGPAYWLGKKFYEDLTMKDHNSFRDYIAMNNNYLIGANYLNGILAGVDSVLDEYTIKKTE